MGLLFITLVVKNRYIAVIHHYFSTLSNDLCTAGYKTWISWTFQQERFRNISWCGSVPETAISQHQKPVAGRLLLSTHCAALCFAVDHLTRYVSTKEVQNYDKKNDKIVNCAITLNTSYR